MKEIISVIMPAFNAGYYLNEAIKSVLQQSYQFWELLIIDDGSTDNTKEIIKSFSDERIKYFYQTNKGVSAARNLGLAHMKGIFFCFLDADDILPPNSLQSRLALFNQDKNVKFVDGVVEKRDSSLKENIGKFKPSLTNRNPLVSLANLSGACFFGPSWMVKREEGEKYQFQDGLSHAEDLLFYMQQARYGGIYNFTEDTVYIYRNNPGSAMKNLEGLEKGYWQVYNYIKDWEELTPDALLRYQLKVKKIMFLSYLRAGKLLKALKALI